MPQQTKLFVGLGNPGPRYKNTKHNVGFQVIDELLRRAQVTRLENLCQALLARTEWRGAAVIFAKPMTYMNNSGSAIAGLVHRFGISTDDLCVIYDDLHLDIGVLRLRRGGSDGGHNGMKSIIRSLGTQDFPRLRIGIGESKQENWMEHVLSKFSPAESVEIDPALQRAADAIETFITDGLQTAMNRFNKRVERWSTATLG
ncbi:aminoacyl-tRNA hydrolase [Candidatus Poribacteria bacterium]|nr:aminoacyl-tRNA hydrolase [Candidatus Poribacteria bacterium]